MYEHVVVKHLLFCNIASATQRYQPAQSRKKSTCRSECDNTKEADRVRENQHIYVEHLYSTLSYHNGRRIEICPAYKNMQLLTQRCCDPRRICL